MSRPKIKSLLITFSMITFYSQALSESLFKTNNHTFTQSDLSPAQRQALYEADNQHYQQRLHIFEQALLEQHIEVQSKKLGQSPEQTEKKLFAVSKVSEAEAKTWYENNKTRLGGRPFDTIKADITSHLSRQKQVEVRSKLIQTLKQRQKFTPLTNRPEAPVVKIASSGFPSKGSKNPKVEIIEFADYGCPHCKHAASNIKQVMEQFKANVSLTFIDFPLRDNGIPIKIAQGAHCAHRQNKYWEFHYQAFEKQSEISLELPKKIAKNLGLDEKSFAKCMDDDTIRQKVLAGRKEGERLGINGTPAIYINGRKFVGYEAQELAAEIAKLLKNS